MAEMKITMLEKNSSGGFNTLFPKTTADQVQETADKKFVTAEQAAALAATNTANGYVKAGADGYIPLENINPITLAINVEYDDIPAMLAANPALGKNLLCFVDDATGDTTVKSGWAIYRRKNDGVTGTLTLANFVKVQEEESLDVNLTWDSIQNKPTEFTPIAHNQASNTITAMTGYAKATARADITEADTLNVAIGKLEKALEDVNNTIPTKVSELTNDSGFITTADVTWANLADKPTSAVADIDTAVTNSHTHTNMASLDKLTVTDKGALNVNGKEVAMKDATVNVLVSETEPTNMKVGDFWYQVQA